MTSWTLYWKHKTHMEMYGKRKEVVTQAAANLPYVKSPNGSHYGTYREYRFNYPCGTYKEFLTTSRKELTGVQIRMLQDYDKEARAWWNRTHPKKKCKKKGKKKVSRVA